MQTNAIQIVRNQYQQFEIRATVDGTPLAEPLLLFISYGMDMDVVTPRIKHQTTRALYDLFQTDESLGLRDGTEFVYYGKPIAKCSGVHVINLDPKYDLSESQRRAERAERIY